MASNADFVQYAIDEIMQGSRDGSLKEIFASGTAAVISPIGTLCVKGEASN